MAALLEPHIPALRRFGRALTRDPAAADDLVQDCLERAIGRWHLRRPDGNLRAWLFAILLNQFRSGRRTATRRGGPPLPLDEARDGIPADPAAASEPELRLACREALAALDLLPEEQRTVLLLVGVEDLSYEVAAELTGVPIGTVMSRLSRARDRLRRLLEGEITPATARPGLRPSLRRVK